MKNVIVKDGRNLRVVAGNAIEVMESLPAKIYELYYNKHTGFSLNEIDSFFSMPDKLYGDSEMIAARVLNSFEKAGGNLGVLFSGPKGLGKSLTVRRICRDAISRGLPVILVKKHFENVSSFIETVHQASVIVMDEFEKLYPNHEKTESDDIEGQESLLNLFDAALSAKKLFLLTCNDTRNISEYLLNRPGRLHYHFRVNRLSIDGIKEYCLDNLIPEARRLIPEICALGARVSDFSYDMLKAVIFELNEYKCGLNEAKDILNINSNARSPFSYRIYFKSGKEESGFNYLDILSKRCQVNWFSKAEDEYNVAFADTTQAEWDGSDEGCLILGGGHIKWGYESRSSDRIEKIVFTPAKVGYVSERED